MLLSYYEILIGLTGQNENRLETFADVCIHVPETETYKIHRSSSSGIFVVFSE